MGLFLVLIAIVVGLYLMPRTSVILLSTLFLGSLYYWYSISGAIHGGGGPTMGELKLAMTLWGANIGSFVLALILGILKKVSTQEADYVRRKKNLFVFLAKWGAIYTIYSFAGGKLIDWIMGGEVMGDEGVGWLFMRAWGIYGFIAILLLWLIFRRKKTM